MATVMKAMDRDKDGKISPKEFESVGTKGLPSFEGLGAEGHHYDVESGECTGCIALNVHLYSIF